jgi:hypothetical protein
MDSIFGDNYMLLETPYFPRDLATIDRVPEENKRCRICQAIKPLTEFRTLKTKNGTWPYYACNPCSRDLQRQAYQHRKIK